MYIELHVLEGRGVLCQLGATIAAELNCSFSLRAAAAAEFRLDRAAGGSRESSLSELLLGFLTCNSDRRLHQIVTGFAYQFTI